MSKIKLIPKIIRKAGEVGFILKKASPEIALIGGLVGFGSAIVLAHSASIKAELVMGEHEEKMRKIALAKELSQEDPTVDYTEEDFIKDTRVVKINTFTDLAKIYLPVIGLTVLSASLIIGSHGLMRKRNLALAAAFKSVDLAFKDYRKRVVKELGEQKDHDFLHGILSREKMTVTEIDEDGNERQVEKEVTILDPDHNKNGSIYARYFGEGCSTEWTKSADYNFTFLKNQERWANQVLEARGHVFLNEIYDNLGFKRTAAGAITGWLAKPKGKGDGYISFGLDAVEDQRYKNDYVFDTLGEERMDFVMGIRNAILLDFNVDGPIYEDIEEE